MFQVIETGADFCSTTAGITMEVQVKSWQQYCCSEKAKERTHGGECQVAAVACLCHLSWGIRSPLTPPVLPVWDDTGSLSAWLAHWLSVCPSIHLTACLPPFHLTLPSLAGLSASPSICQNSLLLPPVFLTSFKVAVVITIKIILSRFSTCFSINFTHTAPPHRHTFPLPSGHSSSKPSMLTSFGYAQAIMATSHFNYKQPHVNADMHVNRQARAEHNATENNTSSETRRYKSSFHSLPDALNFKQVLLFVNMRRLCSPVSEKGNDCYNALWLDWEAPMKRLRWE